MSDQSLDKIEELRDEIRHYRKVFKEMDHISNNPDYLRSMAKRALDKYPDFDRARPDRPSLTEPYKPKGSLQ